MQEEFMNNSAAGLARRLTACTNMEEVNKILTDGSATDNLLATSKREDGLVMAAQFKDGSVIVIVSNDEHHRISVISCENILSMAMFYFPFTEFAAQLTEEEYKAKLNPQ